MAKRILIIEDELIHFDVVRAKLELEGYEVFTARDGVEGSRLIQELRPDLIFLDALLPKGGTRQHNDDKDNKPPIKYLDSIAPSAAR